LALTARYDAQCRERSRVTPTAASPLEASRGFFEELFGLAPSREADPPALNRSPSIRAQPEDSLNETEGSEQGDNHLGGALAICVRQCDGGFFPVSYSARRANLEELDTLCKALCPNAEVALYTKSLWGELDSAVSRSGESYGDHPNALKFQKTRVPACGCKPPDKSWAEALADAERILASSNSKDVVVTEEQAEQLSRPLSSSDARDRAGAKKQSTRRDAPTVEGTTGPLAAPATGKDPGASWRPHFKECGLHAVRFAAWRSPYSGSFCLARCSLTHSRTKSRNAGLSRPFAAPCLAQSRRTPRSALRPKKQRVKNASRSALLTPRSLALSWHVWRIRRASNFETLAFASRAPGGFVCVCAMQAAVAPQNRRPAPNTALARRPNVLTFGVNLKPLSIAMFWFMSAPKWNPRIIST
jgi:hypothetical protein